MLFEDEPVMGATFELALEVNASCTEPDEVVATGPGDAVFAAPVPDIMPVYVML